MGVANLWQSLGQSGAVEAFSGATPDGHAELLGEVQGTAVAVDLSTWIMQALSQPALQEHYATPAARALSVVLWRTTHWLRHGCLPVFVVEGATPPEKYERLRERFAAQQAGARGPLASGTNSRSGLAGAMAAARVRGNHGGAGGGGGAGGPDSGGGGQGSTGSSRLDAIGRAVRELLDALGVPHVQAVGEAEATCAALSACGWVSAAATLDVDALLFGAQAVWRHAHLAYDAPSRSELVLCRMASVRRALGLRTGGQAALVAVAQLAGGDYHVGGAAKVGDALALAAVRALLAGRDSDEDVPRALAEALDRGPDPTLAALTKCTGCRTCGHESGGQGSIKQHASKGRTAGCAECGTKQGCVAQHLQQGQRRHSGGGGVVASSASGRLGPLGENEEEQEQQEEGEEQEDGEDGGATAPVVTCHCRFHATADARTLNRVIALALDTPGFRERTRRALAAYARQTQAALSAVVREFGVPGCSAAEAAAALEGEEGQGRGAAAGGGGGGGDQEQPRQQPQQHENVFRWRHRPDVARVAAIMARHCGGGGNGQGAGGGAAATTATAGGDWSRAATRLRLMPLLLEWDLRQGPAAFRSAAARRAAGGVQFRPTAIRKVSTRGYTQVQQQQQLSQQPQSPGRAAASAAEEDPLLYPPGGWRYILEVERVVEPSEEQEEGGGSGSEDLRTDRAWLAGTVRLREASSAAVPASSAPSSPAAPSQPLPFSQSQASPSFFARMGGGGGGSQRGGGMGTPTKAAGGGSTSGGGASLYAEHRTVRRALVDALWPDLTAAFAAKRAAAAGAQRQKEAARRARAGLSAAATAALAAARERDEDETREAEARAAVAAAQRASSRGKISHYFSPSPSPSPAKNKGQGAAAARTDKQDEDGSPLGVPSLAQRLEALRAGGAAAGGSLAQQPAAPPIVPPGAISPAKRVRTGAGAGACYDVLLGELPSVSPAKKQQQSKSGAMPPPPPRRSLFAAAAAAAAAPAPQPRLATAAPPPADDDVIDLTQMQDDEDG
jgi:transcription elongation factor Elf1